MLLKNLYLQWMQKRNKIFLDILISPLLLWVTAGGRTLQWVR